MAEADHADGAARVSRLILVLLALLTGCATRPGRAHDVTRDDNGCYWIGAQKLIRDDTGEQWCDPK